MSFDPRLTLARKTLASVEIAKAKKKASQAETFRKD